jgi:ribosome maturation factor RimP
MDRHLKKLQDYQRFSGRKARINTSTPVEGKKFFSGTLKGLEEDAVLIEEDNGRIIPIPFARIYKSRLEIDF